LAVEWSYSLPKGREILESSIKTGMIHACLSQPKRETPIPRANKRSIKEKLKAGLTMGKSMQLENLATLWETVLLVGMGI